MKTNLATTLILAVLFSNSPLLWGSEQEARVILLDNDNLFEGNISRTTQGYLIKLDRGGEISISADRVKRILPSKEAAYKIMQEQANLRDADERMRLAFWCERFGLREQARHEAETALRMRPGFRRARDFLEWLGPPQKAETKTDSQVIPAKAESTESAPLKVIEPPAPITYNTESFNTFATQVNTILLNACFRCHGAGKYEGAFKLDGTGGRKAMMNNLQAALRQLNREKIEKSPLLVYAILPHGNASDPPLRDKQKAAIENLNSWARWALAPEGTPEPPAIAVALDKPISPATDPSEKDPQKLPTIGESFEIPPARSSTKDPFERKDPFEKSGVMPIPTTIPGTPVLPTSGSIPVKKTRPESPFAEDAPAPKPSPIKDALGRPIPIGVKTPFVPQTPLNPTEPDDPDDFASPKKFNSLPKP